MTILHTQNQQGEKSGKMLICCFFSILPWRNKCFSESEIFWQEMGKGVGERIVCIVGRSLDVRSLVKICLSILVLASPTGTCSCHVIILLEPSEEPGSGWIKYVSLTASGGNWKLADKKTTQRQQQDEEESCTPGIIAWGIPVKRVLPKFSRGLYHGW